MKFTLDVTVSDHTDPNEVADAIHNYLCSGDVVLDVISYDSVEPTRTTLEQHAARVITDPIASHIANKLYG
jgi:hypothetical protein